jgi:ATP-binding cassette subfamily A (ABC1) protein 3
VTLFRKRYTLLLQKASWISYGINLIIPIIIASALVKFLYRMDSLQTCQDNIEIFQKDIASEAAQYSDSVPPYTFLAPLEPYNAPAIYPSDDAPSAFIGPSSAFSGSVQDSLYINSLATLFHPTSGYAISPSSGEEALSTRQFVNDTNAMIAAITNSSLGLFQGFGIFAPIPEAAILFHDTASYTVGINIDAFSLINNRIRNSSTTIGTAQVSSVSLRSMRHMVNNVSFYSLPIALLIMLAFVTASSIAVIYPAYEKINHVRALHYCNGVSPFALWFGYLLFDMQFIIIQAFFVWGLLFAGTLTRLWYGSSAILGVFILFGIATYLGTYALSLFVKKAAFAIAAGLHVLLAVLYL